MAEFSLGAAIGATGKFPKYTAPEQKEAFDEKDRGELDRLKGMVAADKKLYHSAYLNDVKNTTAAFYKSYFDRARQRDPNIVESTYMDKNNWDENTDLLVSKSKNLFALEELASEGRSKGFFVPQSVIFASNLTKNAKSEADLKDKLSKNPQLLIDGYVTVDQNTGMIVPRLEKALDFESYMRKEILTKDKAKVSAESIGEPDPVTKIQRTVTITTIPANRIEAESLKELHRKRTGENLQNVDNAYDLGYNWFVNNPTAVSQYAAIKLDQGDATAIDKTPAELYESFYKDYVLPNIPSYDKTGTQYVGGRSINVFNVPAASTPSSFQVADKYTINYSGGDNVVAKRATVLSKDPSGTKVLIPKNKYIINMETGKSAFKATDATQANFYISTVAVMPSAQTADGTFKPIGEKEVAAFKNARAKIVYLPWALADEQQLNISTLPTIGKATYAIPLFEPTVEDGKTKIIIPKEYRTGDKIEGASLILGALFQNQKLDKTEIIRWREAYQKLMAPVRDSNEAIVPQ
jgi:hypothetical protein